MEDEDAQYAGAELGVLPEPVFALRDLQGQVS